MSRKTTSDPFRLQEVFLPILLHLAMIPGSELQRFKPNREAQGTERVQRDIFINPHSLFHLASTEQTTGRR